MVTVKVNNDNTTNQDNFLFYFPALIKFLCDYSVPSFKTMATQWAKGQGRRLGRAYCWGQGLSLCPLPALSEGLDSGLGKFASPFGELSE